MRKPIKLRYLIFSIGCFVLLIPQLSYTQLISYQLEIDEQQWNSFHVRISIEDINENRLVFVMPAWRPGAYVRCDFGQYVKNFQAFGTSAQPLQINRMNQGMWCVEPNNSTSIRVEYDVDHATTRLMGDYLEPYFALVDGSMNFMYIKGKEHHPLTVEFRVPHGWKLATALPGKKASFEFSVNSYHELIDCPVMMSRFRDYYFTINGIPIYVIVSGRRNFDMNDFLVMIKRIVYYQTDLFNDIPFDQYFFLFQILSQGHLSSGLEHRNSTFIKLSNNLLKRNMKYAAEIAAHEFFHLWNVKRIQPKILKNANYTQEARTKNLWFCEGVTSYYADLTLIRSSIWSEKEFLEHQAKLIEKLRSNSDRHVTTLEQASLSTWEHGFHSPGISYYTKGQLIGLLLDLKIREITDNKQSLDDLIRFLNWWFAKNNEGYDEEDILRAVNAITFHDFSVFFEKYIAGTIELPYAEFLNYAGITVDIKKDTVADLGFIRIMGDKNEIIALDETGSLAHAGVKEGDYLVTIDDKTVHDHFRLTEIADSLNTGAEVPITVDREGIRLSLKAIVGKKEKLNAELDFIREPNEKQLRIRRGWLEGDRFN